MSEQNTHPQLSTDDLLLSSPTFSQCAWCRCRLDEQSDPIGEPLPDLANEASHGICTRCERRYFPIQAERLPDHEA